MRISQLVALAIEEDLGNGDVTTENIIDPQSISTGYILSKQELVVSGQAAATEVFRQLDVEYTSHYKDGSIVPSQTVIGQATGRSRDVLIGERIALNFLMRLSGIATHTHGILSAVDDRSFRVVDTRKTTPLHRKLERKAVADGGGNNHRHALYDGILIKDNHITAAGGIEKCGAGLSLSTHWGPSVVVQSCIVLLELCELFCNCQSVMQRIKCIGQTVTSRVKCQSRPRAWYLIIYVIRRCPWPFG